MTLLLLALLIMSLGLFLHSRKKFNRESYHLDLSEYDMEQVLPVGVFLYQVLSKKIRFNKYREVIHQRYGAYAFKERYQLFIAERLTLSYLILTAFIFLALLLSVQDKGEDNPLIRGAFGEGHKYNTYNYSLEKDGREIDGYITLRIPEQSATRAEALNHIHQVVDQVERYLSKDEYGELETYSNLTCPTNLSGVSIDWESHDRTILRNDGRIKYDALEDASLVQIKASYQFQNTSLSKIYTVKVHPIPMDANASTIEASLEEAVIEASQSNKVVLPEEVGGYQVHWTSEESGLNEVNTLVLGILLSILFYFLKVKSFDEKLSKRRDSIAIRLPNLINKIALLIQAGMTFHSAWIKVTEDYIKLKEQSTLRYELYEEMIITLNDMAKGLSETRALEEFARRIGMKEVHRFVSIVTQNIKKGNQKLSASLIDLAYQGWQKREMIAKVKGEKAGTQMMLPVAIMLVAMMMMLLTPAVISINI